jgi:hypothetical protein
MRKSILPLILALAVFSGNAAAQEPAPNASVSIVMDDTTPVLVVVDGDSSCYFRRPELVGTSSDFAFIRCFVGDPTVEANLYVDAKVRLRLDQPITDDFAFRTHTITWTLLRLTLGPGGVFSYDINLDGVDYTGTF